MYNIYILVGGFKPSDKYEFVSWDGDIPQTTNQTNTCIVLGMYFCKKHVLTQLFTIETLEHRWASMMSVNNISACMYCCYQDIIFL